jgi:hypothetical protein
MNPFLKICRTVSLTVLLLICASCPVVGQVAVEEMEGVSGQIYRMKITPAGAPTPTFKYRFSFLPHETTAGNAATHYLRSFADRSFSAPVDRVYEKYGDAFDEWNSNSGVAIEDLLETPAKEASKQFDEYIDQNIERATRCRKCDWGYALEDMRGPDVLGFVLPSVQDTRSVSRVLALRTRVAIAEKRFEDAVHLMRMNYQLAASVNEMDLIICSLVAIAEAGITNGTVIDLMATPGSPNMYWALTELPRPIVDLRESVRMDVTMINRIFPKLFEAEGKVKSVEQWRQLLVEIVQSAATVSALTSGKQSLEHSGDQTPPTLEQLAMHLAPTVIGILSYENLKQQLIKNGEEAQRVEAMPVAQVLTNSMVRSLNKFSNDTERWIYLPFAQAKAGMRQEEKNLMKAERDAFRRPGGILSSMLLPATEQVFIGQMRVQRDIDALRVIEAIRMHAAETGQLPPTLDDISVVPIPMNPATNKPFEYQLNDGTATLELPRSDGIMYSKRFELRL